MKGMFDNLKVISKTNNKNERKIDDFQKNQKISIEPLFAIRGRSMPKVYFIIDEAQNLTPDEVKTIITRAGEGTKIILIGDITQIDSPKNSERSNGLSYVIEKFNGQEIYAHIVLQKGERSFLSELASNLL
jgi:PhoH-like ATPase